jgi:hypothetical protein
MSESTNQLCGTVRGRRLSDAELVKAVSRFIAKEQEMICFTHIPTDAADKNQQVSITSLNQNQA